MRELDKANAERARKAELELARKDYQARVIAQMKVQAKKEKEAARVRAFRQEKRRKSSR